MADFTQIIQEINDDINTNGVGAITGAKLNEVLRDMIAAVNAAKQDPLTIDASPTEDSINPVQSGGVYDALGNLYQALSVAESSLFGGVVGPLDPPTYGDDYRYCYLAKDEGRYENFNNYEVDSNALLFYWTGSNWGYVSLWETSQFLGNLLSGKADKVNGATQGNLAGLDSDGNLTDSGIAASDVATTSDLAGKQDTISDLATIRSGAAAGATAYQKPSGGIPKTDLASGVQTSLGKADTAFQKPSGGIPASDLAAAVQTSLGKADTALQSYTESDPVFSASPAAGITSGDIADWDAKEDPIPVVDASTIPASMDEDKVYQYGTLAGDTTFPALNTPTDLTVAHVYCWTFATPSTAPTITWPVAITAWAGGSAPTINASKSYEVSVMDGLATIIES